MVSLARSRAEADEAQGLAPMCRENHALRVHNAVQAAKIALTLPTPVTASEAFFHSLGMARLVDQLLAQRSFDMAFVHCSAVGRYLEHVQGLPKLIDFCDVDSRKWLDYTDFKPWPLSWGYHWEAMRLAAVERRLAQSYEVVTVATPGERDLLVASGVGERVDWFANGVDGGYFMPSDQAYDPDLITFVGRMDYFPNEQCMEVFCAEVLPLLRRQRPAMQLQIVGAAPTARVKSLERHPGVTVTGSVTDVRPYVQQSLATVAPLLIARGTQNKILESMAMGVPVVCSPTAAKGVDAEVGRDLLAGASAEEVAVHILQLAGDPARRARLAEAGRARVLSNHGWESAMNRLDGIIERCLAVQSQAPLPERSRSA